MNDRLIKLENEDEIMEFCERNDFDYRTMLEDAVSNGTLNDVFDAYHDRDFGRHYEGGFYKDFTDEDIDYIFEFELVDGGRALYRVEDYETEKEQYLYLTPDEAWALYEDCLRIEETPYYLLTENEHRKMIYFEDDDVMPTYRLAIRKKTDKR